jgi:HPt (histidine-containing phosphotransfer) domain-containing protein
VKGDRERCLEAGMTDHVSKPINPKLLLEKIDTLSSNRAHSASNKTVFGLSEEAGEPLDIPATSDPIDRSALLARCMGNLDLMARLLDAFEPEIGKELKLLDAAVSACDREQITQVAHSLKGAAANLSAEALSDLARDLEQAARRNEPQCHSDLVNRIRQEFGRCVAAIPTLNVTAQ